MRAGPSRRPVWEPPRPCGPTTAAALVTPRQVMDECGFRMLEAREISAAIAFPEGYIPSRLT